MQVKKQQLEPDMEQWAGSKFGMGYIKDVYCHVIYLTYMQSTSSDSARLDEVQVGIRIAGRNINNLRLQNTQPLWQKAMKNLRASWWKWQRRVENLA